MALVDECECCGAEEPCECKGVECKDCEGCSMHCSCKETESQEELEAASADDDKPDCIYCTWRTVTDGECECTDNDRRAG